MWLLVDGFEELVAGWWQEFMFEGTSSFIFWSKLKALKGKLKTWNREVLGRIDSKLVTIQEHIELLDQAEQQGPLSEDNMTLRNTLKTEYLKLATLLEVSWKQKSRIFWLTNGDNNTRYFHSYANNMKNHNAISVLRIDGILNSNREEIKGGIIDFYTKLYSDEESWRPHLDQIQFASVSSFEEFYLEQNFEEEEILKAITKLGQEKAPGPDGYTITFFSHFWHIIKIDFMAFIADFHRDSYFDWRINVTFLFLIPTKDQVDEAGDFRPISLISSTYKIVAKALAFRLKLLMSMLVSENQTAYIKGRQITHGIMIANELVDSRLKDSIHG